MYGVYYFRESIFSFLTVPILTLMLLRTFLIFHDCGHNSYTPNRNLNYAIGSAIGSFVMTPFSWNSKHFMHHLSNGNIENPYKYQWSETIDYTVLQYKNLHPGYKILYRIFKDPFIFFTMIPFFNFFILNRITILLSNGYNYASRETCIDWAINNILLTIQQYIYYKYSIFVHYNIAFYFTTVIGFILFHNQHTFNPAYIKNNKEWTLRESGLEGSSFIIIPPWLKYFTMGIEYHHIHHCMTRIPGYHLQVCNDYIKENSRMIENVVILSMKDVFNNLFLTLYDESTGRYVSFNEIKKKKL
jgi:omega-6 fatty acid desaturase (delta-12 desaturase)